MQYKRYTGFFIHIKYKLIISSQFYFIASRHSFSRTLPAYNFDQLYHFQLATAKLIMQRKCVTCVYRMLNLVMYKTTLARRVDLLKHLRNRQAIYPQTADEQFVKACPCLCGNLQSIVLINCSNSFARYN